MKSFVSLFGVLAVLLIATTAQSNSVQEITELDAENFYRIVHEFGYHLIVFHAPQQKESAEALASLQTIAEQVPSLDDKLHLHTVSCSKIEITREVKIPKCPTIILIRSKPEKKENGKVIIDRQHYFYAPPTDEEGIRSFGLEPVKAFLLSDWKNSENILPKSVDEIQERKRMEEMVQKEREQLDPDYFVKPESNILSLNELNLDSTLKNRKNDLLVEFFSPSCTPCKNMAREWEDLADAVKERELPLTVASVNCKAYPKLCNRFAIDHYPTVYLFHDNKVYDFGGKWKVDGFIAYSHGKGYENEEPEYIKNLETFFDDQQDERLFRINTDEEELELPKDFVSQVEVVDASNFEKLILKNSQDLPWLLEFYAPWCGFCKKLEPTWEALALRPDRTFRVGKMDATEPQNKPIADAFGVRGYPNIKMISGGKVYDYTGGRSLGLFMKFMSEDHSGSTGRELSEIFSKTTTKDEL